MNFKSILDWIRLRGVEQVVERESSQKAVRKQGMKELNLDEMLSMFHSKVLWGEVQLTWGP